MVELRQCVGRYITFSKQDILKDLGSATPEAQGWDMGVPQADSVASPTTTDVGAAWHSPMETQGADDTIPPSSRCQSEAKTKDRGTPPADSTTSPTMANAEDAQPGPMEVPPVDKNTVPIPKPNTETKKDLPTAWAASPAKLGNKVAPTARSVDKSVGLPTPSGHPAKEKQCVSALAATMEILSLEAPSVAVGCQWATVEELAEEDLSEGPPECIAHY